MSTLQLTISPKSVRELIGVARDVLNLENSPMGTAYELPRLVSHARAVLAEIEQAAAMTITRQGDDQFTLTHQGDTYPELTREQVVELALKLGVLAEAQEQLDFLENQEGAK